MPKLTPVVWGAFLLAGGLSFLVYFWSVGFKPELDLKTTVTLLAASVVTGSILLIVSGASLLSPGWLWRGWIRQDEALKSLWYDDKGKKFVHWRAVLWLGLPVVGALLLTTVGWWNTSPAIVVLIDLLLPPAVTMCCLWRKLQNNVDSLKMWQA